MNLECWLSRGRRFIPLFGLFLTGAFTASASGAASTPALVAKSTVVKPGEEVVGTGISFGSSGIYFSTQWHPGSDDEALFGAFSAPMPNGAPPAWSRSWPGVAGFDGFLGAGVAADGVYFAGSSYSQTFDSVGGKERKEIVAKFNLDGAPGGDTAGAVWVARQRFYPGSNSYDGDEYFNTAHVSIEGGTTYFYGAGHAQASGCASTYAIRKYTASGSTVWQWQATSGVCGGSDLSAIVVDGSNAYASGFSGFAGNLPQILQFSAASGSGGPSATWSSTLDGYTSGTYTSMVVYGGNIYAAGYLSNGEQQAYLLDEWSTSGTRLFHKVWSSDPTKSNGQQLTGVVAVGSRLFVVGYTRNTDNPAAAHNMGGASVPLFPNNAAYHGYGDGVIFEVSPGDGSLISTTSYGTNDGIDQAFTGVTTDGTDLYVVGGERDTTSGPYHAIVLRYGFLADLAITKTDGQLVYGAPGSPITYVIVASNAGPGAVTGATVADTVPAAITGATWTCVGAGGGACAASGSGSINDTVNLPLGGTVTYTLAGTIDPSAAGSLSNTATVAAPGVIDPNPTNNSATDTDAPAPADLSITKTDGQANYGAPGSPITYVIVASNAGPAAVTGATVADAVPAAITGATWTCVGAGGGACAASGSGSINHTVNLPVGATVTYTLAGTIDPSAAGNLSNTATVTPPGWLTDPNPSDNSATDTDTPAQADLSITKTDGLSEAVPGSPITYTIEASNAGPGTATGATVVDTLPTAITGATWTCVGAGGGTCAASGSGNINDTVNLPVGATVTYTLAGTISPSLVGILSNTATVAVPPDVTDPSPVNNSATDTDASPSLEYYTVSPCRVVDTRGGAVPIGGPVLQGQETRVFFIAGNCNIPATAKAISVNVAVTQPSAIGNIRLFPAGQTAPTVSSINYTAGQTRGNNGIVVLGSSGAMAAFIGQPAGTTVHLIVDVNGYFE